MGEPGAVPTVMVAGMMARARGRRCFSQERPQGKPLQQVPVVVTRGVAGRDHGARRRGGTGSPVRVEKRQRPVMVARGMTRGAHRQRLRGTARRCGAGISRGAQGQQGQGQDGEMHFHRRRRFLVWFAQTTQPPPSDASPAARSLTIHRVKPSKKIALFLGVADLPHPFPMFFSSGRRFETQSEHRRGHKR